MGNVSVLEFVWVLINTITLVLTITALADARADREAVRLINGRARELAAGGIVRRERLRVVKQLLLLSIAIPGLFYPDPPIQVRPDPIRIYPVIALMFLSVLLLYQSYSDARERKRLTVLVTAEALETKGKDFEEVKQLVREGTATAERAFEAANHVKERFDAVNERIDKGEELATERHSATADVIDTTATEVHELHEGIAPVPVDEAAS